MNKRNYLITVYPHKNTQKSSQKLISVFQNTTSKLSEYFRKVCQKNRSCYLPLFCFQIFSIQMTKRNAGTNRQKVNQKKKTNDND